MVDRQGGQRWAVRGCFWNLIKNSTKIGHVGSLVAPCKQGGNSRNIGVPTRHELFLIGGTFLNRYSGLFSG